MLLYNMLSRGRQEPRGTGKIFILLYTGSFIEHQGEKTFKLSSKRRQEWIARINRKDWVPSKYVRVWSDHFVAGM